MLLKSRTEQINSVRGWARSQLNQLALRGANTFPARIRQQLGLMVPQHIEWQLKTIEALSAQISLATKTVVAAARQTPVCLLLMTAPGVGPITALRFLAAVEDISRFPNSHALQSYLGLVPGEHSSGERTRRTGITKAGPTALRWTLVEAAHAALRFYTDDPIVIWAKQVSERRGKHIAVVAMARKLAGLLYAMWRDAQPYSPTHEPKVSLTS
jgi:transposase